MSDISSTTTTTATSSSSSSSSPSTPSEPKDKKDKNLQSKQDQLKEISKKIPKPPRVNKPPKDPKEKADKQQQQQPPKQPKEKKPRTPKITTPSSDNITPTATTTTTSTTTKKENVKPKVSKPPKMHKPPVSTSSTNPAPVENAHHHHHHHESHHHHHHHHKARASLGGKKVISGDKDEIDNNNMISNPLDNLHEHHHHHHHHHHESHPHEHHEHSKQRHPRLPVPSKPTPTSQTEESKLDHLKMKQMLAESNEARKKEKADKRKEKRKEKDKERREKRKLEKKKEKEEAAASAPSSSNSESTPSLHKKKSRERKPKKSNEESANSNNEEKSKTNGTPKEKEKRRRNRFEVHLTREQVEAGLEQGELFYGTIRVNAKKFVDAYITVEGSEHDCYVDGIKNRNRGFHTDIVVFKILPEGEWKKRPSTEEEEEQEREQEVISLKDSTSIREDQGTIALPPFQSPSIPKRKEEAESHTFDDEDSETDDSSEEDSSSCDSEDESEDDEEQQAKDDTTVEKQLEKLEIEDDFVIINDSNSPIITTTTATTKSNSTMVKTKKQPKFENVSGLAQDRDKLAALTLKAFKLNKYVSVKVVHILEAKHTKNHVGLVTEDPQNNTFALFTPLDQTLPRCFVFRETMPQEFRVSPEKFKTKLVSIQYGSWKESSMYPIGRFGTIFGECGDIEPETRALLKEYHVDTEPFSREVMNCLPKLADAKDFKPSAKDYKERRDLRDWIICSIDPDTAKDLDDALSCEELPDGNLRVGVHIADVSHFVTPDTALDTCAQEKATTVYLVQRAIPMLPSLLSEELCSLNYGVERFAFSVVWTMTKDGKIIDEWFGKSVIKSASRLTYGVAQKIIEGAITTSWDQAMPKEDVKPMYGNNVTAVVKSVLGLRDIARSLRKERVDNGAFTIHPTKLAFSLDEKGNPCSTRIYPIYESNHLVEEFMLLANMQVAKRISKYFPSNSLLRRHPDPNQNKLERFISFCAKHGFTIDSSSVGSLGASIISLREKVSDSAVFMAMQMLSVRSMKLAEYFSTGDVDEEDWRHYALNVGHYTHFTSPIRRYPDIVVHRLLQLSIDLEKSDQSSTAVREAEALRVIVEKQLPDGEWLTKTTKHCNEKKMNSRKAQERSDKVFLCVLLDNHPTECDAVILAGGNTFIQVLVPMFGGEQRIYLADLKEKQMIIKDTYDGTKDENTITWPSIENDIAGSDPKQSIVKTYPQLSTVRVLITVDKSKFPIDTKCTLLHPNHINVDSSANIVSKK